MHANVAGRFGHRLPCFCKVGVVLQTCSRCVLGHSEQADTAGMTKYACKIVCASIQVGAQPSVWVALNGMMI